MPIVIKRPKDLPHSSEEEIIVQHKGTIRELEFWCANNRIARCVSSVAEKDIPDAFWLCRILNKLAIQEMGEQDG